jgi:CBS domain-containing protein
MSNGDVEMRSRQECLSLLRGVDVGRLGLSVRALPVILAVRFVLADDDIIFSSPSPTVDAALSGTVVCFEADEPGAGESLGWSVLVTGRAWPLTGHEPGAATYSSSLEGPLFRLSADLISSHRGPLGHRPSLPPLLEGAGRSGSPTGDHRPYQAGSKGPKLNDMRDELDELLDPEPGGWDLWSPVRAMMTTPVTTITGEATLRTAAELMATEGMGALIVERPNGSFRVITERDLVLALADGADPDAVTAADVASPDLLTADPEDMVKEVAAVMADYGIRHVPVQADGKVVGMVSARDILRAVATR